ncbi:MAG: hypothetical protein COB59_04820 [Rhodospirillaceae bacterium]|nr:MAG: hypothetical protein COB59_04820 [Rhodospirillaceae bacterium]
MITFMRSAAVVGAVLISAMSFEAAAASKTLEFTVTRDGSAIGTHAYTIDTNGADTTVSVSTDIRVKALFLTVYKFIHESKEVWSNGKLVSLNSTTDDDGTEKSLKIEAKNGQLMVEAVVNKQNRLQYAALSAIPASLWNPATVKQNMIVNTLDGQQMKVDVENVGSEEITAAGSMISANHYKITGELTRDLWFNTAGDLVRISFPDKTDSKIIYSLN